MKVVLDDSLTFKLITFDGGDMYFEFEVGDDVLTIPVVCLPYLQAQIQRAKETLSKLPDVIQQCLKES